MTIRIMIVDDHPIVLEGLCRLVEGEPEFTIAGNSRRGSEALKLVSQLQPDVLVLDLMMPGMGGLETARHVKELSPNTRIVFLSMHKTDSFVLQALRMGASGYVLKDSDPTEIFHAIRVVAQGKRYLSREIQETLIDSMVDAAGPLPGQREATLTPREWEVLRLIAKGLKNREIATMLSISRRTVEQHRYHIMAKLDLHSQAELLRYVYERGIEPTEG